MKTKKNCKIDFFKIVLEYNFHSDDCKNPSNKKNLNGARITLKVNKSRQSLKVDKISNSSNSLKRTKLMLNFMLEALANDIT